MEISAKITNQILRVTQRHSVVSKSRGIYSLKVEYDKEWENITERVVIFKRLVDGLILAIKDSTGEVVVPWEVTDKISQVEIGVIGYNDNHEKIISTTAISGGNIILIAQATPNNGVEPLAPSPDIWNQIRGDLRALRVRPLRLRTLLIIRSIETEAKYCLLTIILTKTRTNSPGSNTAQKRTSRAIGIRQMIRQMIILSISQRT